MRFNPCKSEQPLRGMELQIYENLSLKIVQGLLNEQNWWLKPNEPKFKKNQRQNPQNQKNELIESHEKCIER